MKENMQETVENGAEEQRLEKPEDYEQSEDKSSKEDKVQTSAREQRLDRSDSKAGG